VARGAASRRLVAGSALGYLAGKALVYTLLGVAVTLAGQRLAQQSIPVIIVARKVLGPAMLVLGLYLLGAVTLRFSLGHGLADRLEARVGAGDAGRLPYRNGRHDVADEARRASRLRRIPCRP
jgi:cytochrome c biogenesis protein CcdA